MHQLVRSAGRTKIGLGLLWMLTYLEYFVVVFLVVVIGRIYGIVYHGMEYIPL